MRKQAGSFYSKMRKVDLGVKMIKPVRFQIKSIYDVENIYSLRCKLDLSQAQMYRVFKKCEIPLYCLPNSRNCVFIHSATLWRFAKSTAFKKYIRKIEIKENMEYYTNSYDKLNITLKDQDISNIVTVEEAVNNKILDLSVENAISAAKVGLIPCTSNYIIVPWFIRFLKGELEYPLPKKA